MLKNTSQKIAPLCPVFGQCGGCQYQDIFYAKELMIKECALKKLLREKCGINEKYFSPIVPSPKEYTYRSRLDLKMLKIKSGEIFMGFSPKEGFRVIETDSCAIAMDEISAFLPELKEKASAKMPAKYRNANLTVKAGDDKRVLWGGIGRRSLRLKEDELLWIDLDGKRIFYSLETFFQANVSILPVVTQTIRSLGVLSPETVFLDLYGGVGLFGIALSDSVGSVVLVEENKQSVVCAKKSIAYNALSSFQCFCGRMEDVFSGIDVAKEGNVVAMIDPPRAGLSDEVREMFSQQMPFKDLLYLSCNPETLANDVNFLINSGWHVRKIIPFDFFPKTRHIETLVLLKR